jgi:predicted nucleic acid-binding protein
VTADTSVVVAALSGWHEAHDRAASALAGVQRLPAHVVMETFTVLTRLPGGLAVAPEAVAETLGMRFPAPSLTLDGAARRDLPATLAAAGVSGGAGYDALVALEAGAHTLLTLDPRAHITYAKLGTSVRVV